MISIIIDNLFNCEIKALQLIGNPFSQSRSQAKEDSSLRDALSKTIQDIRADGTYKVMNDKYFAVDIYGAD